MKIRSIAIVVGALWACAVFAYAAQVKGDRQSGKGIPKPGTFDSASCSSSSSSSSGE